MAREKLQEELSTEAEKKKLKDEKQKLKKDQKAQRKEAKKRAKEIARQEEELDDSGGGVMTFFATIVIVALWIVVICIVIKMDIGGFGSSVLAPVLKDVPVINKILPKGVVTETFDPDSYGGYSSLEEAVAQIRQLELEVEQMQREATSSAAEIETLKAEVLRLQPFEEMESEFKRVRDEFYREVIYADNGPGPEEYRKYYEEIDPDSAEYWYRQVMSEIQETQEVQNLADSYASMEAASAADIMEAMPNDLNLCARILQAMTADKRGAIMAAMEPDFAAKLTRIMDSGT
ncbi:MAG: hypothetical protein NC417_03515 [Candidatus Gastranaerophilales bacterium]|nr:hypothetical protein [Candidatus Gastranaerophilales bacterium]